MTMIIYMSFSLPWAANIWSCVMHGPSEYKWMHENMPPNTVCLSKVNTIYTRTSYNCFTRVIFPSLGCHLELNKYWCVSHNSLDEFHPFIIASPKFAHHLSWMAHEWLMNGSWMAHEWPDHFNVTICDPHRIHIFNIW